MFLVWQNLPFTLLFLLEFPISSPTSEAGTYNLPLSKAGSCHGRPHGGENREAPPSGSSQGDLLSGQAQPFITSMTQASVSPFVK